MSSVAVELRRRYRSYSATAAKFQPALYFDFAVVTRKDPPRLQVPQTGPTAPGLDFFDLDS